MEAAESPKNSGGQPFAESFTLRQELSVQLWSWVAAPAQPLRRRQAGQWLHTQPPLRQPGFQSWHCLLAAVSRGEGLSLLCLGLPLESEDGAYSTGGL